MTSLHWPLGNETSVGVDPPTRAPCVVARELRWCETEEGQRSLAARPKETPKMARMLLAILGGLGGIALPSWGRR
jgi:hypothetical protein